MQEDLLFCHLATNVNNLTFLRRIYIYKREVASIKKDIQTLSLFFVVVSACYSVLLKTGTIALLTPHSERTTQNQISCVSVNMAI